MTTTTSTLEGTNFLQPTGFKIIINRKRFKNLEFFAQSVQHPSVSMSETAVSRPRADVFYPGDKLQFSEITVQAILDENMNVYNEVFDWMNTIVNTNYVSPSGRNILSQDGYEYDMQLIVLTSANTEMKSFKYKSAFPIMLGDINFNAAVSGVEYITMPMTFKYSTFSLSD